jgi:hypothetical protein
VSCPAILEDGVDSDDNNGTSSFSATSTLLLTDRGPISDELSKVLVPAGSLMSSSQDTADARPSRVTPPSVLRLPRPGVPATVTSGAYIRDSAHQSYIRGGVIIATAPEEDPLDITSGWGRDVKNPYICQRKNVQLQRHKNT